MAEPYEPTPRHGAAIARMATSPKAVQAAIDHALLWLEWKALAKASNKAGADVVTLNRRMTELQAQMDAALAAVKRAKNARGNRAKSV